MMVSVLRAKLHRACITDANLEYPGSLGVSTELLRASGLLQWEKVLVANLTNGSRLETYIIELSEPGQIVLNGAAAHHGQAGDRVIVMSFAQVEFAEAHGHQPKVVVLNERNEIVG
jgi:aspartate 1-decarboxylase